MKNAVNKSQGFTLIELMITVVIVAILASIAVPAYSDYILRGKITEAVSNLSDMRAKLEQYFQDNRSFIGACVSSTIAPLPSGSNAKYFTYTCPTLTASTFIVTATGNSTQGMSNFTYTINQSNAKATTSVPTGWIAPGTCWALKKDGSC